MLHHHLPALKNLTYILSSRFVTLRFSKSRGTTDRFGFSRLDNLNHCPVAKMEQETNNHLEIDLSSSKEASFQPSYELGQLQSVQTLIGNGRKGTASDGKIHLTHELEQQQARID